jgi:hypothetical protein
VQKQHGMVTGAPHSTETTATSEAGIADRRKRQRVVVSWPLRVWKAHEPCLEICTVNVSSGGFYCLCPQPFSPGETLIAVLEIPGAGSDRELEKLLLRCEVLVLRVETLIESRNYGTACRILDYSVLRNGSVGLAVREAETESAALFWEGR